MKLVGLTTPEVDSKVITYGKNLLPEKESGTIFGLFLSQFKSPLIYILVVVIIVSLIFKRFEDAILIGAVVLLDIIMGFAQEYSAQRTLKSLKKVVHQQTTVIRNGKREIISTVDLVPGDIILLGSGDKVPADSRLIEGSVLVSEAILTGEEEPVEKLPSPKKSSVFMGTIILSGRCTAQVISTGKNTEIGKIGISLSEIKDQPTPLQKKLAQFSRSLALLVILLAIVIFLLGVLTHHGVVEMISFSLILAVAAIPEGLPIAVTVILSIGMRRVLKRKGLVKKLLSIETLGSTSVICTDKTGTITEGVMRVVKVDTQNRKLLLYGLNMLNTRRTSLEIAIWDYLKKQIGTDPQTIIDQTQITYEETFESEKKYAVTAVEKNKEKDVFLLGAPEIVLKFCRNSSSEKDKIMTQLIDWTKSGLRVVGLIHKKNNPKEKRGYLWLGMLGIEDPIRKGVKDSVAKAQGAGIEIKIVTGDFRQTAETVAKNIGLVITVESVIEGSELEKLNFSELKSRIKKINLFCRVSPHQKMKIITALQEQKEVVAMTGDGVNDAPALKKADIGVVVNSATDVAKDSGDLILLDNNFNTIVAACEEGRIIYENIIKVVGYVLSNSLVEIVLIVGSMLLDIPFPLTVIQILWLHLICDGPLDIALGFEPGNQNIMSDKPQKFHRTNILSKSMLFLIFAISFTAGIIALLIFNHQISKVSLEQARTLVFGIIGSIDLIYIFSYKDLSRPVIKMSQITDNKFLLYSILYGFIILISGVYLPFAQKLLHTIPLSSGTWIIILGVGLLTTFWVELIKKFHRSDI